MCSGMLRDEVRLREAILDQIMLDCSPEDMQGLLRVFEGLTFCFEPSRDVRHLHFSSVGPPSVSSSQTFTQNQKFF